MTTCSACVVCCTDMDYRDRFQPAPGIYLYSHSVGRPPRDVAARVEETFFRPWCDGSDEPWSRWLPVIERFRGNLAGLFGGDAADYCPQANLSSGLTKILQGLPRRAGRDVILLSEDDFPSMGFVLEHARREGQTLRFIPAGADVTDAQLWRDHLDERIDLVFICHVHSNTGRQLPVSEIVAGARRQGAWSVVDIAQSAGVLPVDVTAWQADFVLGSCVKWLCGGPGAGFLWGAPGAVARCEPRDVGWFSHAHPFEFDIHHFEYRPGAQRFWGGTPSVLPYATANVGLETLHAIGVDTVRAHNLALSRLLLEAAGEALQCPREDHRRSGTVILDFDARMDAVCAALDELGVRYDRRVHGLRLSPHIYNTQEEMERVADCFSR